jgi:[ribosomal protein S5]-alanine N-acetyltransferase
MLNPSFCPFPILTTERLLLREMVPADAPGVLRLRSDKDVMKYINRPLTQTIQDAEAWIDVVTTALQKAEGITWCMAVKENPSGFVGTIGLWRLEKENYRAEIGYMLDPSVQGQGIMSEAIQKVVDYGFRQMGLHSIEGRIDPRNIASARVLEKSGFVQEAYFKENYYLDGRFADTAVYSLLTPHQNIMSLDIKHLEASNVS